MAISPDTVVWVGIVLSALACLGIWVEALLPDFGK